MRCGSRCTHRLNYLHSLGFGLVRLHVSSPANIAGVCVFSGSRSDARRCLGVHQVHEQASPPASAPSSFHCHPRPSCALLSQYPRLHLRPRPSSHASLPSSHVPPLTHPFLLEKRRRRREGKAIPSCLLLLISFVLLFLPQLFLSISGSAELDPC